MITAICCVVRLCLTRFKDKVSYVFHIVDIYLLSRSFTLHANVNILKFKFRLHTNYTLHYLLLHIIVQDVTHRSESIIGNLIDKSILLDFTR